MRPRLSEDRERELVVDYQDGFKIQELVDRYGVSTRTVHRLLAKHHMKRRGTNKRRSANPAKKPRELLPCGTNAAYQRHRRNKEYPCAPCLAAHAANIKGE